MEELQKYIDKFYYELIKSSDFDGNYFKAKINAIAMAKAFIFIKNMKKE